MTVHISYVMGWYSVSVYFLTAPTPLVVVTALETMTGFSVALPADNESELFFTHPAHPAEPVILTWSDDRLEQQAHLEATVERTRPLPFPTHPFTITLEVEMINTRAHRYLRNVALAALLRLGGITEHSFRVPACANCVWQDAPPRSFWQKLKSLWVLEF